MVDVALQGRGPMSPGSIGLMRSRADYGRRIEDSKNVIKGAVDALEAAINDPTNVDERIMEISQQFKMSEGDLARYFEKLKGISPHKHHRRAMIDRMKTPIKI